MFLPIYIHLFKYCFKLILNIKVYFLTIYFYNCKLILFCQSALEFSFPFELSKLMDLKLKKNDYVAQNWVFNVAACAIFIDNGLKIVSDLII
ncbi:Uncharacterised protein [Acetobacterium wieringae]|nr:Uncharacterised protein [Acetobacterium wieringae]